jgi:large subunit ribosomal protein L22
MESRHTAKNINVSIRKVRTFLPEIKKMTPVDALVRLQHLPYSATRALAQAIQTTIANAESSLKVSKDMLEFRKLYADQGLVLKRFRAGSRGTAKPISRRMTHITVVLGVKQVAKSQEVHTKAPKKQTQSETVKKDVVAKELKPKVVKQKEKVTKVKKVTKKEN